MVARGWTWIESKTEHLTDEQVEDRTPTLDMLARRWSELKTKIENEGFQREADMEPGADVPEFESAADAQAYATMQELREQNRENEISTIEEKMAELGARIMRPYEHWAELEKVIEYEETRHDND